MKSRNSCLYNSAYVELLCSLLQDCHGPESEDKTVADEVQNYELISGYQNDTHTTVEFRRQLDTCDSQDFIIGVCDISQPKLHI